MQTMQQRRLNYIDTSHWKGMILIYDRLDQTTNWYKYAQSENQAICNPVMKIKVQFTQADVEQQQYKNTKFWNQAIRKPMDKNQTVHSRYSAARIKKQQTYTDRPSCLTWKRKFIPIHDISASSTKFSPIHISYSFSLIFSYEVYSNSYLMLFQPRLFVLSFL